MKRNVNDFHNCDLLLVVFGNAIEQKGFWNFNLSPGCNHIN